VKQDAYSQEKRKKNRHRKKEEEKRERIALLMCFEFLVNQLLKHSSFFLLTVNFNDPQNHASGKENKAKELILPACLQYEGLSCQKTKPFNSLMLLMLDYHLFVFRPLSICMPYNLSYPGSYNYVINV